MVFISKLLEINYMGKLKDYMLDHPDEIITGVNYKFENPFAIYVDKVVKGESDMTHEELNEDRGGHYEGSPLGGWPN
jgi:hypothetical protein